MNNTTFIIIASSDCRVSLHNIDGVKIGVFGQSEHWKLDKALDDDHTGPTTTTTTAVKSTRATDDEKEDIDDKLLLNMPEITRDKSKLESNHDDTNIFSDEDFIRNPTLRYNPWSKTILGLK